jgi:hypothetical protein
MIFLSFTIQVQGVFEQLLYRKGKLHHRRSCGTGSLKKSSFSRWLNENFKQTF